MGAQHPLKAQADFGSLLVFDGRREGGTPIPPIRNA